MKNLFKAMGLVTLAVLLAFVPASNKQTAHAANPDTYRVRYDAGHNGGEWIFTKNDDPYECDMYYLNLWIKDGDILVVEGNSGVQGYEVQVSAKLSELTYFGAADVVVFAPSVDHVTVLYNTFSAFNGYAANADLYGSCTFNFNNNVGNLTVHYEDGAEYGPEVYVVGTVDHVNAKIWNGFVNDLYDFDANTFFTDERGVVATMTEKFKWEPSKKTTTTTTTKKNDDELDDVPKTGSFFPVSYILFGVSGLFAGCGLVIKGKKSKNNVK